MNDEHHRGCACQRCIRERRRGSVPAWKSEKTCNLCNVREGCRRRIEIDAILHRDQADLGKDYDGMWGALGYICDSFVPLPGGGEGTVEYINERHREGDCIDNCPLCEDEGL
jgi:hypothetical protein